MLLKAVGWERKRHGDFPKINNVRPARGAWNWRLGYLNSSSNAFTAQTTMFMSLERCPKECSSHGAVPICCDSYCECDQNNNEHSETIVGCSDSGKDVGCFTAAWELHQMQCRLGFLQCWPHCCFDLEWLRWWLIASWWEWPRKPWWPWDLRTWEMLQNIRKGLRGDFMVLMGKDTMMKRSIRLHAKKIWKILEHAIHEIYNHNASVHAPI